MDSRHGEAWVIERTGHGLIGLLEPIGTDQLQSAALSTLAVQAQAENRIAAIYKCNARLAAMARGSGWDVAALGPEAMLNPMGFSLTGPQLAALQRKLRRAVAAGLTLHGGDACSAAERAAVAPLWARARKDERRFSKGL